MRLASFKSSFFSTRSPKGAKSYASFLRPSLRTSMALLLAGATMNTALANEQFASCTAALADKAKQEGVSQQTIDDVFPRLVHQDRVIELDRSQPEFVQTFPGTSASALPTGVPKKVKRCMQSTTSFCIS